MQVKLKPMSKFARANISLPYTKFYRDNLTFIEKKKDTNI